MASFIPSQLSYYFASQLFGCARAPTLQDCRPVGSRPHRVFLVRHLITRKGFLHHERAKERRGRNQLSITTGQTNFFSAMWNDATRRDLLIFYPPSFFIASFCCVFLANDYERVCPKCQATAAKRCWQISYHFHALLHTKLYVQGVSYRMFSSRPRVCVFVVLLICRLTFFPVCLPWSLLKVRHFFFFFVELLAEICFALLLLLLLSN